MKRKLSARMALVAGAAAGLACATAARAQFGIVSNLPGSFTDISATGASITSGDDSSVAFTSSVTNALVTTASLYACTNGDITDAAFFAFANYALPAGGITFGLFPFWDDLYVDPAQGGSLTHLGVVEGGVNVEIVQWTNVRTYAAGPGSATGTFEVKIFASGPVYAQFLYQDVAYGGNASSNGASATIGAQWGTSAYEQFSLNTPSVQSGTVLSVVAGVSGACCLPDGTCRQYSPNNCANSSGTYRGDNTDCATANCPSGACCLPNLTCATSTGPACATQGGIYNGDGTSCATTTCPSGACCLPNLTCATAIEPACTAQGGTYHGNGSTCASTVCPFGACCATDGTCSIQTPATCSGASGIYRGDGTVCATANCPIPPNVWVEVGDAGDNTETANVTVGSGALTFIRGELTSSGDADMYRIRICDIANFQAVTCGHTSVDTQLFLFDANGVGVVADDDYCGVQSTINGSTGCLASASNSTYFLAISSFNNDPLSGGQPIFTSFPYNVIYCPLLTTPMDSWSGGGGTGPYEIELTGTCFDHESTPACYANCDASTTQPCLNVLDFTCFLNQFAAGASYANCDASTTPPVLNVLDFTCFLNRFAAGCSGC